MSSSPYSPSALLTWFHSVPRYDYQLKPAPAALDVSNNFQNPYIYGIAMQAGGLFALGAIVLLLFGVALSVARMCCRTDKAGAGGCCCCCRQLSYCTLSLIAAACVGGALYLFTAWRSGLGDTLTALTGFSSVLSSASGLVSGPLVDSLTLLSSDVGALATACAGAGPLCAAQLPAVTTVQAQAASTLADVTTLGTTLASAATGFQRSLGLAADSSFSLGALKTEVEKYVLISLGVVVGWLVVHLVALSPTKPTACLFRFSTVLTLLLGTAVPVLAGGMYAVALLGSDVCVAPSDSIVRLLNSTGGSSPLAASTFAYFSTCAAGGSGSGGDASAQVASASSALALATARVQDLNASLAPPLGDATLWAAVSGIMGSITFRIASANATVQTLSTTTLACAPVAAIYTSLLNALCGTAITGIAQSFIPIVVAAIALVFLLCYAVTLCANHPGDDPPSDESAELIKGVAWGGEFKASPSVGDWGSSGARKKHNPAYGTQTSRYERTAY